MTDAWKRYVALRDAASRSLASKGLDGPPPEQSPGFATMRDGSCREFWPPGTSAWTVHRWESWKRILDAEMRAIAASGTVGAPQQERRCYCYPPDEYYPPDEGYVRSPDGNPILDSPVPYTQQGAALSTQENKPHFHPAFWVMAMASVAGVTLELIRYLRSDD